VGRFFGEVDGSTMASLIKMGMFKKVSLFDYQAMCRSGHHHGNSARPLLSPFYAVAAILRWTVSNALMFLLEFNFCGLWHSDYFVDAKAGYHTSHKTKKVEALQPCDTAYPGYMYDSSVREANSLIKCGRCQKMFVVQQIPDSGLRLLPSVRTHPAGAQRDQIYPLDEVPEGEEETGVLPRVPPQ
ncbi:hypothetical protein JOQ06_017116, partial [Pogonophryne albipinna]